MSTKYQVILIIEMNEFHFKRNGIALSIVMGPATVQVYGPVTRIRIYNPHLNFSLKSQNHKTSTALWRSQCPFTQH